MNINPAEGYELNSLVLSRAGNSNVDKTRESATKYTATIYNNATYTATATFVETPVVTIKTIDITGGGETVLSSKDVEVPYGTTPASEVITVPEGYGLVEADVSDLKDLGRLTEAITKDYTFEVSFKKIPFTLTVQSDDGADVDPLGAVTVLYGADATVTIKAQRGYNLLSVTVNNVEQDLPLTDDELVLTGVKENTVVNVKVEKETYEVVEGADQTFDEESNLVVKFSGDLKLLEKVYVNGKELDAANYELSEGSTVVTLKKEYLAALDNGTYTLKAEYQNGNSAETTFVIDREETDNSKTGDIVTIVIIALVVSALGMAVTFKRK